MTIATMIMTLGLFYSCSKGTSAPEVGTLTAYYAKEDFCANDREYKKGELICDTNDPFNHITDEDTNNYRYAGDHGGEEYSLLLPKSKVEKKTYTMNQLTLSDIEGKAYFVSEDGCVARIFWSKINGHKFYDCEGKEEKWKDEDRYKECFVLSAEFLSSWDNSKNLFEEQLNEKMGNIELYCENTYRQYDHLIGFVEESWYNKEGYGFEKSAYDKDGKMLVDQWEVDGIPDYISIAYIADMNALYINGTLYYRCSESDVESKGLSLVAGFNVDSNMMAVEAHDQSVIRGEESQQDQLEESKKTSETVDYSSILNECQAEITSVQREIESICRTFAVLASNDDIDMMKYGQMKITFINGVNDLVKRANKAFDKCTSNLQQVGVSDASSIVDKERRQFNRAINELKESTIQQVEMGY